MFFMDISYILCYTMYQQCHKVMKNCYTRSILLDYRNAVNIGGRWGGAVLVGESPPRPSIFFNHLLTHFTLSMKNSSTLYAE